MATDGAEYRDLVKVLNSKLSGPHHFVEILPEYWPLAPGANFECVTDKKADGRAEHTIGIPKKVLVKAFLTARSIFFANLDDVEANKSKLLDSSMIILLFDPEHLTAANIRKKIALSYRNLDLGHMMHNIGHELWLTEFFLMSRLKRHNKSPTLWAHRKWSFKTFRNEIMRKGGHLMEPEEFNFHEISVLVGMSAEHHPRNYYAWEYARWWFGEFAPDEGFPPRIYEALLKEEKAAGAANDYEVRDQAEKILLGLMQAWCKDHATDISGWSFYLRILHRPHWSGEGGERIKGCVGSVVLDYASKLRLTNESIWVFLREIARDSVGIKAMFEFAGEYLQALLDRTESDPDKGKFAEKEITRYREWCHASNGTGKGIEYGIMEPTY